MRRESSEWAKWIPIGIIAVILIIIYKTVDNFSEITMAAGRFLSVISPLLYGVLFAYFLYIPHHGLEKLLCKSRIKLISKRARGISTLVVFFMVVLILGFLIVVILPILITSVIDLTYSLPAYLNFILDYLDNVPEDSIWYSLDLATLLRESSGGFVYQYISAGRIEQIARSIISVAGEVSSILLGLIVSLYLLLERDRISVFFKRLNSAVFKNKSVRDRILKYFDQINKVLFTFIASKGLDSVINLVSVTCILLIFNIPYAFLLGLIAGLFNFIPYLGSLIAVILITLITLITGGMSKAIQLLIPLLIFQQLDGNYIEPRIMKSSLKISPILVIVAVVAGGAYFGVIGMFLAVPVVVIIKQILLEYVSHSEDNPQPETDDEQLEEDDGREAGDRG